MPKETNAKAIRFEYSGIVAPNRFKQAPLKHALQAAKAARKRLCYMNLAPAVFISRLRPSLMGGLNSASWRWLIVAQAPVQSLASKTRAWRPKKRNARVA
jgi:hypothetical protein